MYGVSCKTVDNIFHRIIALVKTHKYFFCCCLNHKHFTQGSNSLGMHNFKFEKDLFYYFNGNSTTILIGFVVGFGFFFETFKLGDGEYFCPHFSLPPILNLAF